MARKLKRKSILLCLGILSLLTACAAVEKLGGWGEAVLLEDDFGKLPPGRMMSEVGPRTEYHFLPEAGPKGNWAVSTFISSAASQNAWEVRREGGRAVMAATFKNAPRDSNKMYWHPMLVAGDDAWQDYEVTVRFATDAPGTLTGVAFCQQTDRCYNFFGMQSGELVLKRVADEKAFHDPNERVLARAKYNAVSGKFVTARISWRNGTIRAELDGVKLETPLKGNFTTGKVALLADAPARFSDVRVTAPAAVAKGIAKRIAAREGEEARLQAANPKPVLWKKISTEGFGVGRSLRFGDLDGDGQLDVLIGQVVHHAAPSDSYSELSCLTAMTLDGKKLWQIGTPDPEKTHLTNDVGFQIYDIDHDGRNEVVYCMNFEICVVDGATGKLKYKAPTPVSKRAGDRYPRILGDCLFFCDLRGRGYAQDIVIKDRYWNFWVLTDKLDPLWSATCRTGHYPFAADIDGDGHDELAMGYALYDHDGKQLWDLEDQIQDHVDGVAIVNLELDEKRITGEPPVPQKEPVIFYACSDSGAVFADLKGNILKHHWLGHVQNPAIADFRPDLPGLEIVSINFWGNQGILHFYDAQGNIYRTCEPNQFGSMCLPVNWTGTGQEYFVHNPNVKLGGMFDGWGRCVVKFPDDGHPDMCNAVMDLTGDCRDEIVVWDPNTIWIYTQSDNPKTGKLYKPKRNPLYNYSNYQATVSLPGWNE